MSDPTLVKLATGELVDMSTGEVIESPSTALEVSEVLEGEIVEEGGDPDDKWEEHVSAFISREQTVLDERFRNAREVAQVKREYGQGSIERFSSAVGISRSVGYQYLGVWRRFGAQWEAGELPANLHWYHYVLNVSKHPEVGAQKSIEDAADADQTTRQYENALDSADEPPNVERAPTCHACGQPLPTEN